MADSSDSAAQRCANVLRTEGCTGKPTFSCGGCRFVHYCSRKCQRDHWKAHKPGCKRAQMGPAEAQEALKTVDRGLFDSLDLVARAAFGMGALRALKDQRLQENESTPFLSLPNVVIAGIFEMLGPRELVAVTAVCARFRSVCRGLVRVARPFPPGWPWDAARRRQIFTNSSGNGKCNGEDGVDHSPRAHRKAQYQTASHVSPRGGAVLSKQPPPQRLPSVAAHHAKKPVARHRGGGDRGRSDTRVQQSKAGR